jgi:hypothetical protein
MQRARSRNKQREGEGEEKVQEERGRDIYKAEACSSVTKFKRLEF